MRVAREIPDQTRSTPLVVKRLLEVRQPALIGLPIPIPSIPVIAPLLSPLVSGSNNNNADENGHSVITQTTHSPPNLTPTTPAAPAPTPTPGGASTGPNTGDSSSSSNSSAGNAGGTGSADSPTSDSAGPSSGGGNSKVPNTGSVGTDTTSANSSDDRIGTVSGKPEGFQSGDAAGISSPSVGSSPVANAGQIPGAQPSGKESATSPSKSYSGTPPDSTIGIELPPSSNGSPASKTNGANHKAGINTPAIVAIVVVVTLLSLLLLVLLLRRRWVVRRHERMNRWWNNKKRSSQTYDDEKNVISEFRTPSIRSSFATTVDHSLIAHPHIDFSVILPILPPLAELRKEIAAECDKRFSTGSASSQESQFLVVHHRDSLETFENGTRLSPRPFLPSEAFSFPKPPPDSAAHSRAVSLAASTTTRDPAASVPDLPSANLAVTFNINPFTDINSVNESAVDVSTYVSMENPFADSQSVFQPVYGAFNDVEIIHRPFVSTRSDELTVNPGDEIKVIKLFDDGWAIGEKITFNTEGESPVRGLFPIDCLRLPEQDLSTFLGAKRVSNYEVDSLNLNGDVFVTL